MAIARSYLVKPGRGEVCRLFGADEAYKRCGIARENLGENKYLGNDYNGNYCTTVGFGCEELMLSAINTYNS